MTVSATTASLSERIAAVWHDGVPFFLISAVAGAIFTHAKAIAHPELPFLVGSLYAAVEGGFFKEKFYGTKLSDPTVRHFVALFASLGGWAAGGVSYKIGTSLASFCISKL